MSQTDVYRDFYRRWRGIRWFFRYDVHYRCRRLREVSDDLGLEIEDKKVLDIGFGSGHMLASFPMSCEIHGAEISESAVLEAKKDARFNNHAKSEFHLIPEGEPDRIPEGPFDIVVSSHVLEHVPNDADLLSAILDRLTPGGLFYLFVPIEDPGYNPDHVRNYSLSSIAELVGQTGFDILFSEGSMHLGGHIWKLITIPSRRGWPVLKTLVDAFRSVALSIVPYRLHLIADRILDKLGFGPRQAFIVARAR
jgi:2-polyprenyl-3-methyl-5-hydroxy-6-metoxy-1,4-benzoquinol methylase